MAAVGLARATVAPRGRPGVQGIASHFEDILLRDGPLRAQVGDALLEATLSRTIGGGSTLTLEVHDPERRLLRSKLFERRYDLRLDGLPFRFVKASSEGRTEPLTLVHEARAVAALRALHGPHKAFRNKVTRAEFANRRVREAKPAIRFVCPQLHVKQPIRNARQGREAKQRSQEERGKGIDEEVILTVKGDRASSDQLALGDRALRVAEEENAPARVMVALIVALIQEAEMSNPPGGDSSSVGCLQLLNIHGTVAQRLNVERSVRLFLVKGFTGSGGAISIYKGDPSASPAQIAATVQGNAGGAGDYAPWTEEARKWVAAYGGGQITSLDFNRYAFEEKQDEDHWACIRRLASEVHWRCFESAGWVYFITDEDLLASKQRILVSDSTPGIEDTAFDYDIGKEVTELRVTARARSWAAPPGSVVGVTHHGPADGRYLVHRIDAPLRRRDTLCEITLRRPVEPLPEPAPSTRTVRVGDPGGVTTGDLASVKITNSSSGSPYWGGCAAVFKQFIHPFMEEHGLTPGGEKEEGHVSGSDHALTSLRAYATDYATTDGGEIANELGRALGRSGGSVGTYERFTFSVGRHRFSCQILWHVPDHYDHVHVGLQAL